MRRRREKPDRIKVLTCPDCGSTDLYYETGLITGYKYHCKKCNYVGPLVIERYVSIREDAQKQQSDDEKKGEEKCRN